MTLMCIYHGKCDDGFGAAWALRHKLVGPERPHGVYDAVFFPGEYGKPPPDVTGFDVVMVDFSYRRQVINEMANTARSVLILDHHKTAEEDLRGLPEMSQFGTLDGWIETIRDHPDEKPVAVLFDMGRSGAGITWDFAHAGKKRPLIIDYLEDRDLWRRKMPRADSFTANIRSYPQDFTVWSGIASLLEEAPEKFLDGGDDILRYYRVQVASIKSQGYLGFIPGDEVTAVGAFANAPYAFASEVAGELIDGTSDEAHWKDEVKFGACFFERADGRWQYSLRSRSGFDVSAIAKRFGGGGHAQAAGFDAGAPVHRRAHRTRAS